MLFGVVLPLQMEPTPLFVHCYKEVEVTPHVKINLQDLQVCKSRKLQI